MADLIQTLQQAGFKGDALRTAYAIAMRESGGRTQAYNPDRSTGDDSYGLFQINMLGNLGADRRSRYGLKSNSDLYDPLTNASVAYKMSKGGTDFGAWGLGPNAYRSGAGFDTIKKWYESFPGAVAPSVRTGVSAPAPVAAADTGAQDRRKAIVNALLAGDDNAFFSALASSASKPAMPKPKRSLYSNAPDAAPVPKGMIVTSKGWKGSHVTDGLDLNKGSKTAGDIMAAPGTPVGAPESGTVFRWGSAQGGEALYFRGDSGKVYWMGHIDNRAPVGTKVRKDQVIASVSADHPAPHLHIDAVGGWQ